MIGRNDEKARLHESLRSTSSELIAVYGRRRVGKTYLIRNTYGKYIKFEMTGLSGGNKENQLGVFWKELNRVSNKFKEKEKPTNWDEAFELLKKYLNGIRGKTKKVIFLDEFPWLDTHKSDFLMYFGHFWNTYCERRDDLVVVICGSAAAYMVRHIVSNKGSLHARVTYKLQIRPFTLFETNAYLKSRNIDWGFIVFFIFTSLSAAFHTI